ncbi:hypothetical protein ACOSQ3_009263 [Xanthoceras sorbifolium]
MSGLEMELAVARRSKSDEQNKVEFIRAPLKSVQQASAQHWSNRILLQTVPGRDAILFNSPDLLLLLVSLANKITSNSSYSGWLSDNDLNKDRLDLFYWLSAALSLINFFNYLFWSRLYYYNPSISSTPQPHESHGEDLENQSFNSSKHLRPNN